MHGGDGSPHGLPRDLPTSKEGPLSVKEYCSNVDDELYI
jgi:hypothetical protein